MTTYKKIEQELEKTRKEHEEAKKKLEEFEKDVKGKKLNELEEGLFEGKWIGEENTRMESWRNKLEKEKERLEAKEDDWGKQVIFLQTELAKFNEEKGNEQIA